MLREFADRLQEIGLTEKESAVYIALLDQGAATADQTSKRAKLNRSTTYVQIESLTAKGLVSSFKNGKKTFFAAESPNNLERLLETRATELELQKAKTASFLPDLLKIYASSGNRPVVRLFEGKEGLTSMREEIIQIGDPELLIAFSFDNMSKIFTDKELMDFSKRRAAKNIISKTMYTKSGEDIPTISPQQLIRVTEESFPFGSDVYIYGDNVSFAITGEIIAGVTISSASVAQTLRTMFTLAWERVENRNN